MQIRSKKRGKGVKLEFNTPSQIEVLSAWTDGRGVLQGLPAAASDSGSTSLGFDSSHVDTLSAYQVGIQRERIKIEKDRLLLDAKILQRHHLSRRDECLSRRITTRGVRRHVGENAGEETLLGGESNKAHGQSSGESVSRCPLYMTPMHHICRSSSS